ncbi:MAG: histidine--tRNA ligase [Bacteroidetes bacterium]|nr:histidine--tRNA ligase [Bacteroidota bacterium]
MKPSIPQGTRDFSPIEVRKRQYIFQTLKNIFECSGFQPLETPAMENLSTLMGKYGDEGDRLIFKILNNGLDNIEKRAKIEAGFLQILSGKNTSDITERALRYDLTIPFARYIAMHQNDIAFPFRRYQMQPVWRADRPQRGRYREFWQCDCDVVGSTSLLNEAELLCIYQNAFHKLQIPDISVKLNSRKILAGLAELADAPNQLTDITVALDKLDKIGWDGVKRELEQRGISEKGILAIEKITQIEGNNDTKLRELSVIMQGIEIGQRGIEEIQQTLHYYETLKQENWQGQIVIDFSLARGLNYYTGIIVEVTTGAVKMGSIGGGGRYDDLTGLFGVKGLSGVGISFGIDRIFDVLDELQLFPQNLTSTTQVLIINFGGENEPYALSVLQYLRAKGIASEFYPDAVKFDKQMKYANKRGIPFVLLLGDDERANQKVSLKNFNTGEQKLMSLNEVVETISANV